MVFFAHELLGVDSSGELESTLSSKRESDHGYNVRPLNNPKKPLFFKAIDSKPTLTDESVQRFNLHSYYWGGKLLCCRDGKSILLNSTTCFCSFLRINAAP